MSPPYVYATPGPFGSQVHSSSFHWLNLFGFWLDWPIKDPREAWRAEIREKMFSTFFSDLVASLLWPLSWPLLPPDGPMLVPVPINNPPPVTTHSPAIPSSQGGGSPLLCNPRLTHLLGGLVISFTTGITNPWFTFPLK